jgi:hypothetical protein
MTSRRRTVVLSPSESMDSGQDRAVDKGVIPTPGLAVGGSGQIELSTATHRPPTSVTPATITPALAAPVVISPTCPVVHRIHRPY